MVLGAHYDTKDLPGFVGANDGASGTAVVVQLARTIKPRTLRRTIVFALFDGEESPRGTPDSQFERAGLRGSRVAARHLRDARAMVLLDFVGNRRLSIPREGFSDPRLWRLLRHAARRRVRRMPSPQRTSGASPTTISRFSGRGFPRWTSSTSTSLAGTGAATTCRQYPSAASTPPGRPCSGSSLASEPMPLAAPEKLLLAAPRGYCAGVDRAVQAVERALELYGPPVYVRKEIVHNKHVVEQLRARGAVFVEQETDVPEGETVVFSAHGVAPTVHANSEARGLRTVDATCPLVTKVHVEAKKFAAEGYTIILVGHEGHEEVEGTMGEAPDHFVLIETEEDVDRSRWTIPSAWPT